jgi:hypothetical protein
MSPNYAVLVVTATGLSPARLVQLRWTFGSRSCTRQWRGLRRSLSLFRIAAPKAKIAKSVLDKDSLTQTFSGRAEITCDQEEQLASLLVHQETLLVFSVCLALHSALQELLAGAHPESQICLWVKECPVDLDRAPMSEEDKAWINQYLEKLRSRHPASPQ